MHNNRKREFAPPPETRERAHRLRFLRKMVNLSMKEFAQLCNLGLTTINYWEQGYSNITERGAKKVCRALRDEGIECSTIWLMSGLGAQAKVVDSSKLSKLNYSFIKSVPQLIREEELSYLEATIQAELKLFKANHPDGLVHQINDHGMYPLYCKDDIVAGERLTGNHMELANGMDCIVEIEQDQFAIRRIRLGQSSDSFDLYVINAESSLELPPLRNQRIRTLAPISRIWKSNKF